MARVAAGALVVGLFGLGIAPTAVSLAHRREAWQPAGVSAEAPANPTQVATAPATPAQLQVTALRPVHRGDVVSLTARGPAGLEAVTGSAFGHEVRLYADADGGTWRGLIGVDLDVAPGPHVVSLVGSRLGSLAARGEYQLTVEAKRFPTRRLRVDSRFVEPPASEEARIVREAERLAKVFTGLTPRRWDGPFRTPLPATPNSNFGTRSVFNGQARNPHAGVDFAGPTGTPVAAPNAGVVVLAENLYFTGNTVILDHGLGLYSLYAHLSRIDVALGGVATTGQTLGLLGATGRVTGPHLHWAVRLNEARVDPLSLVTATSATRVAPSGTRVEPADPSRPSIPAGRL